MTPRSVEQLLEELSDRDISLSIRDGQLDLEGPVAELQDDLVEELRTRKAELIKALDPEIPPVSPYRQEERVGFWTQLIGIDDGEMV